MAINFFNSLEFLEPKCRACNAVLDYGVTTRFDEKRGCHVCLSCGEPIK